MSQSSWRSWDRVSLILNDLLDRPEREWEAVLDERCGDDAPLRRQVRRLLAAHQRAEGFLARAPSLGAAAVTEESRSGFAADEEPAPERVGSWRLMRELGRGGMGVVYLAERIGEQFRQRAALKLVHGGLGRGEILARFRRERQILAGLNHPYIARLLDGGCAEDGRPYLTMEYVDGRPLTSYCRDRALDVEDRLRLFVDICQAVQHAHVRLVVHRDLKPSNILITDAGEPRLLDFGIAKVLAEEESGATLTRAGLPLMTPDYAAPEQLRGEAVSTATDIYALGLILFEILVGRHPFRDRGPATGEPATRRDPPRPSLAATDRALRRRLAGDLDTIVLMALREEPGRRYASAEALARDVERHLAGLSVSARPDTVGYRTRKFAGRHRWGLAMSAAAASLLMAFAITMAEQARRTARQRDRAERVSKYLVELFSVSNPLAEGGNITAREILDRGARRIDAELAGEPEVQADLLDTMGRVYFAIGVFDRAEQLLQRSVDVRSRTGGAEDPRTLSSLTALGNVLVRAGRFEQGIRLFRQTFEQERRSLGADDETTLRTMNDLAFWLGVMGRWNEAEILHRDVLERRRRRYGEVHGETVWSVSDLGVVLMREGRYSEAEPLLAEAVEIWRRVRSPGDPDSFREAIFRSSLGNLYLGQKRYAEAERIFVDALATIRRVMGLENGHTAAAMRDLALLWSATGRLDESEALLRKTLDVSRTVLGPRHYETLQTRYGLAVVLAGRGGLDEAEKLQLEALAVQREILGADHPDTLLSMANLGRIRAKQGRVGEGRQLLEDALAAQTRLYGAAHPHALESVYGLACLAALSGHSGEALNRLRQAVQSDHVDSARVLREPDLGALKGDPRFQSLLAAAELHAAK